MKTKIVLFPNGSMHQIIDLVTWDFPDIRPLILRAEDGNVSDALVGLQVTMDDVVTAVRNDTPLPDECFIPDMWHHKHLLPTREDGEAMWNAVATAGCIVREYYTTFEPHVRKSIDGMLWSNPKQPDTHEMDEGSHNG